MFSTLETTWDQSVRRGCSALASFGFEALSVSLLLLLPLYTVEGPKPWVLLQRPELPPIFTPLPPEPAVVHEHIRAGSVSNVRDGHIVAPPSIPDHVAEIDDAKLGPPMPQMPGVEFGRGPRGASAVFDDNTVQVMGPVHEAAPKVVHISSWAEGNLVHRVQPVYPKIAIQARIQGPVQLQAIISKTGTIEHLTALGGPPMLIQAAKDAVQQWRYRPYLLNGEPIEVETEVTVNFILAGSS